MLFNTWRTEIHSQSITLSDHSFAQSILRNNFSFKCHRRDATPNGKDQSMVYAVNNISFHPVHGTFSTCGSWFNPLLCLFSELSAGSDGTIHFWDKDGRTRLKCRSTQIMHLVPWLMPCSLALEAAPGPITATAFNHTGSMFAYSVSYDWSKGHSGMTPNHREYYLLVSLALYTDTLQPILCASMRVRTRRSRNAESDRLALYSRSLLLSWFVL